MVTKLHVLLQGPNKKPHVWKLGQSSIFHGCSYNIILSPGCPWSIQKKNSRSFRLYCIPSIFIDNSFSWEFFSNRTRFAFWYFHCFSLFPLQFYWYNLTYLDRDHRNSFLCRYNCYNKSQATKKSLYVSLMHLYIYSEICSNWR